MQVSRLVRVLAAVALVMPVNAISCSRNGDSTTPLDADVIRCGDGFTQNGPVCIPDFDYCMVNEVALAGGGCMRVGAPATCLKGWNLVKRGWCEPVLPAGNCPKGSMSVIGKATCQPIRDCDNGKYGNIKVTSKTIYVDRQYARADSDGTKSKPYQSIDDALSAAPSGAHIAVAAGEYLENLVINKQVTLEGRCPRLVSVKGYKTDHIATIQVTNSGTEIRGLSVTGPGIGVVLISATKVVVDRCLISDNGSTGLAANAYSEGTVRYSLVEGNHKIGIGADFSSITVDHCDIRETREDELEKESYASGLSAYDGGLTVVDSVISDNGPKDGILIQNSKGKILRSVIRGTRARPEETGFDSSGLRIQLGSEVVIHDTLIADNRQAGIIATESTVLVERSVIRHTRSQTHHGYLGIGILSKATQRSPAAKLEMKDCTVADNASVGVLALGGVATLERVVIRDTGLASKPDNWTEGFLAVGANKKWAVPKLRLTLRSTLLEDNHGLGLNFRGGAVASVEECTVRSTRKPALVTKPETSIAGGIWVSEGDPGEEAPQVTLKECLVEKTEGFGLVVFKRGVVKTMRTVVRDTARLAGGAVPAVTIESGSKDPKPPDLVLTMKCSAVQNTPGVGVLVNGAKIQLVQCKIKDTTMPGGDGISIRRTKHPAEASLECTMVENSTRAGLVFFGGKGKICQSIFRGGEYAVVLENGANPVICNDNWYENNTRNGVAFGRGLTPVKVPRIPDIKELNLKF